jgi:hypothetical protein
MHDVIPEVVGKFIERGDLDFHPHSRKSETGIV